VTTATRLAAEPEVPTLAESGVKGYDVALWHGLIAPKGMPKFAVDKMNAEVNQLLKAKDAGEQLQNDGVSPKGGTPEAFRIQIRKEIELWKKTVAATGVKAE
jgi:tripartite-type tricarboxylate transporter receptor subunit TctC